jgi:aspartate aminotransferase
MTPPLDTVTERRLSRRALEIAESATLSVAAAAQKMRAEGIHVVSLSTGEPDFPTPEPIKQAGIDAISANFTRYTQSEGILELREAIARKFTEENGIATEARDVLVSSGGKHSIFNALTAICDPGDEVVIPAPYWVSYPEMVTLVGAEPVVVATSVADRYKLSPSQLSAAITPRTRAIIINSPSNPTGVIYSPEELRALGEVIASSGAYLISDELYEKIIYDGNRHVSLGSLPSLRETAITVNGVSKAYAMTGWRIGYMTGPRDVISAAAKIQSQVTSNPSSISQKAALRAITGGPEDVEMMARAFEHRRDLICDLLSEIPDIRFPRPDGAFYIFMDVSAYYSPEIPDSLALSDYLLREHHVATVAGCAFGDDRALRLSYACSEEDIREGIARIARGLAAVKKA